jgi:hypothetical protein
VQLGFFDCTFFQETGQRGVNNYKLCPSLDQNTTNSSTIQQMRTPTPSRWQTTQTRPLNRTNANNIQKPKWSTWATFNCIVTKTRHSKSNLSETIKIKVNNHKQCDFLARKKFIDRKFYLNKYHKITF